MNSRSFLIASSFARLAARAGGGTRLVEGYFPAVGERRTSIQIEGERAVLVVTNAPDEGGGERAEIPRGHAEALLAATAGRIDCLRTSLAIGQRASLVRIVSPGLLDLVTVNFDSNEAARAFAPPAWLGPEISDEPAYRGGVIALQGVPEPREIEATNAGLDSLLDALENRVSREAAAVLTAPMVRARPMAPPEPEAAPADDAEVAAIEDDVIRELARSLRPQPRSR